MQFLNKDSIVCSACGQEILNPDKLEEHKCVLVQREGFIDIKEGRIFHRWHSKWLSLSDQQLSVCEGEGHSPVETLLLNDVTLDLEPSRTHEFCFRVSTPSKKLILGCNTRSEMLDWLRDFCAVTLIKGIDGIDSQILFPQDDIPLTRQVSETATDGEEDVEEVEDLEACPVCGKVLLGGDIASHHCEIHDSSGIIREGALRKLAQGNSGKWHKRWFQLQKASLHYFHRQPPRPAIGKKTTLPTKSFSLVKATLRLLQNGVAHPYCCEIRFKHEKRRKLVLSAKSREELLAWIHDLTIVTGVEEILGVDGLFLLQDFTSCPERLQTVEGPTTLTAVLPHPEEETTSDEDSGDPDDDSSSGPRASTASMPSVSGVLLQCLTAFQIHSCLVCGALLKEEEVIDHVCEPFATIVREGWVYKQRSSWPRRWEKRWAVLSEGSLRFDKKAGQPLPSSHVYEIVESRIRVIGGTREHVFEVLLEHSLSPKLVLACESNEEMVSWLRDLSIISGLGVDGIDDSVLMKNVPKTTFRPPRPSRSLDSFSVVEGLDSAIASVGRRISRSHSRRSIHTSMTSIPDMCEPDDEGDDGDIAFQYSDTASLPSNSPRPSLQDFHKMYSVSERGLLNTTPIGLPMGDSSSDCSSTPPPVLGASPLKQELPVYQSLSVLPQMPQR